jgi:hypothetical protein
MTLSRAGRESRDVSDAHRRRRLQAPRCRSFRRRGGIVGLREWGALLLIAEQVRAGLGDQGESRIAAAVFGGTRRAGARALSLRELRADVDDFGIDVDVAAA